ncbi:MAG TPA: carbohydrate ABC transporter permease [Dictyoglomaceae bacterium]|nr:carbohydrate ABC transporter permease [Dictyoglomaceae bacterium]HOL39312.1 carbohydrate ABC transporter permease [Dictyoglomaceae bacterium]HOP95035.1 carbohydrate ABC transporter permease [Dictyoglomaceae bacterium]HPP16006.1 carbohydrate ABC transporter permease [Dictyoglomaceae bacterium]HPU42973.1 carbohydrate ABC transporter permease [Dictyoglomaceae bacterium]
MQLWLKIKKDYKVILLSVVIWIVGIIWFTPIFWMLTTSLKPTPVAVAETVPQWIPNPLTFENYLTVFRPSGGISVANALKNSVVVAIIATILGLLVAIPAAYALARIDFPGHNVVFWSYVAILAFPGIIFLVPNYFIIHSLSLMNTFASLILPGLGGTFGVFMLRQYMLGIPKELEEVAFIDGCSRIRFLITIAIPIIRPALVTLALMTFLGSWNGFLWPLLVLTSSDKFTLPIALVRFSQGWGDPYRGIGPTMAAAFISVAPVLLIFVLFHKYLLRGISLGAIGK